MWGWLDVAVVLTGVIVSAMAGAAAYLAWMAWVLFRQDDYVMAALLLVASACGVALALCVVVGAWLVWVDVGRMR